MSDKCLLRVEKLLDQSKVSAVKKDEIINQIKIAQAESKRSRIDDINVDDFAQEATEELKLQRQLNKRNALDDEIKIREAVDNIIDNFEFDYDEGLIALLVGSNKRVTGARSSAASYQDAATGQLIAAFNKKLRENNVEEMFRKMDKDTQRRVSKVMSEASEGLPITEKNKDIVTLGKIMEEYSESVRVKLNDRGSNVKKLWGYVVRQSHDPHLVRDAANVLGLKKSDIDADPSIQTKAFDNYNKDYTAWRNFIMDKLDQDKTFANVDDIDTFMQFVYTSLIKNQPMRADGANFSYGTRGANLSKDSRMKRVLHFKDSDAWFEYNDMFGMKSLSESFYSGLQASGRNIGLIDSLGTRPVDNFKSIMQGVQQRLITQGKSIGKIKNFSKYEKYLRVLDGSIHSIEHFGGAKWSAIARAIASMAKLGGATISAISDLGLYAGEMKHQGRSFFGSMFEAFSSLAKVKNTKDKKEIAEMTGLMFDNIIYDVSARYQVGDPLTNGFTNIQRTFFKYNLLSWWTNTLKESAMLGTSNYIARQKNVAFKDLNKQLRSLLDTYNIDETQWNIIRKKAITKSDDGKEFIEIANLDKITDAEIKKITGLKTASKRELQLEKEKFKGSIGGMLLDRTTYAVIEPDAKVRGDLTQSLMAGTGLGESIRFVAQFKAFPVSIIRKSLGREYGKISGPNQAVAEGSLGIVSMILMSGILGYGAMTAKDVLNGKTPRKINAKTIRNALFQGGGLGLYGDILFQETRGSGDILKNIAGPVPLTALDLVTALTYVTQGKPDTAGRTAYNAIRHSIPFANLFYTKAAIDYLFGYQVMESMSPGTMRRLERRMKKDYDQEFIFGNPL